MSTRRPQGIVTIESWSTRSGDRLKVAVRRPKGQAGAGTFLPATNYRFNSNLPNFPSK